MARKAGFAKRLLVEPLEKGRQVVVEALGVHRHQGPLEEIELLLRDDLGHLLQRPEAARERDERVRHLHHARLALRMSFVNTSSSQSRLGTPGRFMNSGMIPITRAAVFLGRRARRLP